MKYFYVVTDQGGNSYIKVNDLKRYLKQTYNYEMTNKDKLSISFYFETEDDDVSVSKEWFQRVEVVG